MLLLKEFYAPFEGINPGVVGLESCESLFPHLNTKKMIAKKNLVLHFFEHPAGPSGRRSGECVLAARDGEPR